MGYCVFRSDLLSGTDVAADIVSLRFYDSEGKLAPVENGTVVKLDGYEEGSTNIFKAVAAAADTPMTSLAIVGSVETMYDERKKNLDEFINEAGVVARGYIPRSRNIYSVTKEAFKDKGVPTAKTKVGIDTTSGKLDISATGFGAVIDIENTGRYTYYVIQID